MTYIVSVIIGYLFGCLQTGFLIGKLFFKKDIRTLGNGNAGASNATVVFGRRVGIATAVIDIIKGIIAIMVVRAIYRDMVTSEALYTLAYLTGMFAVLGHNFPFYMQFRGGKGTATAVGALFGLDWRLGIVAVITVLIVVLITDYIVIGTMSVLVVMFVYTLLYHMNMLNLLVVVILSVMSVYKHRENFVNIRNSSEKRVRTALFKKKKA